MESLLARFCIVDCFVRFALSQWQKSKASATSVLARKFLIFVVIYNIVLFVVLLL
ncbi:hypothetical protein [Helicobacter rodentium]|uniref:hypothetical protein n=1 Tax=Helicobacter rodentium TaxID=59617 RepID=UPI0023561264|nr:hypothetical protein [Helicobacter rodentium]